MPIDVEILKPFRLAVRKMEASKFSNWSGHNIVRHFGQFSSLEPILMKSLYNNGFNNVIDNGELWFRRIDYFRGIEDERRDENEGRKISILPNNMSLIFEEHPHYALSLHGHNITRDDLLKFTDKDEPRTIGIKSVSRLIENLLISIQNITTTTKIKKALIAHGEMIYQHKSRAVFEHHTDTQDMNCVSFATIISDDDPIRGLFRKTPSRQYITEDEWRVVLIFLSEDNIPIYVESMEEVSDKNSRYLPVKVCKENFFDFSKFISLFHGNNEHV